MEKNPWLHSKNNLIGPFVRIARPEVVEMLAMAGYDFGVLDLEHGGAVNMNDVYPLILAAENRRIKLLARIPGVNETYIKWLLDLGIGGLQIPHIKTKADAQRAVEYSKFHPMGERGLCRFVRAAEFSNIPKEEYITKANSRSIIVLQIEGVEGAQNIEEISSVEGVDVIFVGPYDLSQSMGLTGQIWHPDVTKEITRIIEICKKKNIVTGVFTDTPEGIKHWSALGVKYLNYRIDTEMFLDFAKKKQGGAQSLVKLTGIVQFDQAMQDKVIDHKKILDWGIRVFTKSGVPPEDAKTIAGALVKTSLWGIDSHGIARITHYLKRFENGTINKHPKLQLMKTAAATGQLDGDDGHGIVIMTAATNYAIGLAKDAGVGVVGVSSSSHCGAIGLYTRQITESGMVGIAFTHADALVVPHGGNKPFFGTNPISIAFPTEDTDEPICVDMATSIVPWNYMMNAKREGSKVPLGLGVDKDGNDSVVAEDIVAVKPMAEHKGYALAFLIDMLCGPLNGMNYGPNMTSMYRDIDKKRKLGSLVIAIDPARFGGRDTIRAVGTAIINQVRTHGDNVLFPGQPEYISRKERMKNGIPVSETIVADFNYWSDKLGVTPLM